MLTHTHFGASSTSHGLSPSISSLKSSSCGSSIRASRCSACSARDDPATVASRSSAVIFFHGRYVRLVALDIFCHALEQLQQKGADGVAASAAGKACHSVALGARPRPACAATAPRSTCAALERSPPPCSRRPFAQVPRGLPCADDDTANRLLQVHRSAGAVGKGVVAQGHGLGSHRPYGCAHVCALCRSRGGREGRPGRAKLLHA